MSLQVWLPLISDLHNQGVSGLTPVQTTAPTWVDGKLGKAMSTGALYLPANDVAKFYNNNAMSFAFWIYAVGSSGSSVILGQSNMSVGNNRMFTIFQYPSPNDLHLSWQSNESSTTFLGRILYGVFPSGTWTHCAITYDGAKATVYINGVYQTSWNGVSTRTNFTYDVPIPSTSIRYLNDIRIYDHVLSPKEIKLLSQGLVCHYQLNGDARGLPNLLVNSKNLNLLSATNNLYVCPRSAAVRRVRDDGFSEVYCTKNWQGLSFWSNQLNLSVGDKLTYSFYIYTNGVSRAFSFYPMMYNSSGTRDTSTTIPISVDGSAYGNYNSRSFNPTTATSPEFHYVTFEWNSAVKNIIDNGGKIELSIQVHGSNWDTGWACLFMPKLEFGEKPTCWMPNSSDAEYTQLGYDKNIIYDSSGNKYNGEKVGDVISSNMSPRNTTSMSFVNGSYLRLQNMIVSGYTNSYTFAWWGKFGNCNGHMMWGFANGNRLNLYCYSNNCYWNTGDGSNNPFDVALSSYLDGNFHHFAITGDGITTKLYIDGEYKANAKTYKGITGTTLIFNGWDTGNNYNFNGSLSDFRLYATALLADDILELYHTSASIDKDGNLYAYELKEE